MRRRCASSLRATVTAIYYNTNAVPAAEAPKTWKDLLDPRWKGKLVTAHPGYSGVIATHVLALVHLHGWDYFKTLAQNQVMIVQSANDPTTVVSSGERVVAVNGGEYSAYQLKKKGNPIEIVYPKEGVPLVVSPTAITSFAPHPNAARLFTDFTFTREAQQAMADSEGLYTGHPDVTYPADKPKLKDLRATELHDSIRQSQRLTRMTATQTSFPVAPSLFQFAQHGKSGA